MLESLGASQPTCAVSAHTSICVGRCTQTIARSTPCSSWASCLSTCINACVNMRLQFVSGSQRTDEINLRPRCMIVHKGLSYGHTTHGSPTKCVVAWNLVLIVRDKIHSLGGRVCGQHLARRLSGNHGRVGGNATCMQACVSQSETHVATLTTIVTFPRYLARLTGPVPSIMTAE